MTDDQDLWHIEEQFWTGDADFYDARLSADALMVFPEPAGVLDREATLRSIRDGQRWTHVAFKSRRSVHPSQDIRVLVYAVEADRGDAGSSYAALCSSTYVASNGTWRLVVHQQSPVA